MPWASSHLPVPLCPSSIGRLLGCSISFPTYDVDLVGPSLPSDVLLTQSAKDHFIILESMMTRRSVPVWGVIGH